MIFALRVTPIWNSIGFFLIHIIHRNANQRFRTSRTKKVSDRVAKKKIRCTSSVVFTPKSSREGEASALRVVRCAKRSKKITIKCKKRRRVSKPRAHHQTRLTGAVTPLRSSHDLIFFSVFFCSCNTFGFCLERLCEIILLYNSSACHNVD